MIIAQKVWEFRKNVIWDDGKYYVLEYVPAGAKAYFDRTDKALNAVKRKIKQCGSVCYFAPTKQFRFEGTKGYRPTLSQFLYGKYNNRQPKWVRSGSVHFRDGNPHNLTSGNLTHTHEDTLDNRVRDIYRIGDYIFLHHKTSGRTFFCEYSPDLLELLRNHRIVWVYQNNGHNKLQAAVMRKGQRIKNFSPFFHQVVYAFEHYGAKSNNFISVIRKMQMDLNREGLTIDHLDGLQENAMPWNLSLMTISQNSAKNNMPSRVRNPFFLFAVYHEDKYKLYCGRIRDPIAGALDYSCWICETPDDLIAFLKHFLNTEWEDGLSPARNLEETPDAICFQNYFGDFGASGIREELMSMSEDNFSVWKAPHPDT